MENKRTFQGIWIPKEIWFDENLNAIDKVVLAEVDSLDNGEQHCTAGNEYFAKFCQCSEKTISRSITKLIDQNYITFLSFDGRIRRLKSNLKFRVDKTSIQHGQNVYAD
jgi:hypothetical protein